MANKKQILDKIARALKNMGVTVVTDTTSITAAGVVITMASPEIAAPMGGVNGDASPFLGIGVGAPSIITITVPTDLEDLATADGLKLLAACAHPANDIVVTDGTDELVRIPGHPDVQSLGQ
jgi:spermidine synthase